jgi:hypothetical protein
MSWQPTCRNMGDTLPGGAAMAPGQLPASQRRGGGETMPRAAPVGGGLLGAAGRRWLVGSSEAWWPMARGWGTARRRRWRPKVAGGRATLMRTSVEGEQSGGSGYGSEECEEEKGSFASSRGYSRG